MLSISHLPSVVGVSRSCTDYSTAVLHVPIQVVLHTRAISATISPFYERHVQSPFVHYPRTGCNVTEPREPSGFESTEDSSVHETEHDLPQLRRRLIDPN